MANDFLATVQFGWEGLFRGGAGKPQITIKAVRQEPPADAGQMAAKRWQMSQQRRETNLPSQTVPLVDLVGGLP
jgi:hypothetical protein